MEYDYDSAELRVCAGLSGDPEFSRAVNLPDIHSTHAQRWGCTRDDAKTIVYATLYGSAPKGIQGIYTRAGKPVTEAWCDGIQRQFFASYQVFAEWRRELVQRVNKDKCLVNPFGRPRYFWNTKRDVPAALDFLPQSTVADIVWSVLSPARDCVSRHGGSIRTIVHDSFLLEVPTQSLGVCYQEMKKTLERPFDCIAPGFFIPTKCKVGPNWGELTPYVPPVETTLAS